MNILLTRLKSIGDVLFTLPAVHVVRENFPEANITFMVSQEHAPLLTGFRDVNEVLPLDRAAYRSGNPILILGRTCSLLRRLRSGRFSIAIDFQGYGETALLTWCTRARDRWGSVYQPMRAWAYTKGLRRNQGVHPADWNLSLVRQCGLNVAAIRNEFVLSDASLGEARQLFASCGLTEAKPTLFIQPFTSSQRKNWALEHYLTVARYWREQGVQVLFGGGPGDRKALEPACAANFPVSAGPPLLVTAGLMKLSTLVLGGDTGLLHIAAAMGKRLVMVMSANTPGTCHPFQHPEWTVTAKPGEKDVFGIDPDRVIEACKQTQASTGFSEQLPGDARKSSNLVSRK